LWGSVLEPGQRDSARVAPETVPGIKAVRSHLVWIEPMSGMSFAARRTRSRILLPTDRPRSQRQSGLATRGCRVVRGRAEGKRLQGHQDHPA
jgi:hypothetical protein